MRERRTGSRDDHLRIELPQPLLQREEKLAGTRAAEGHINDRFAVID